jgi:hypothetical protein
MVPWCMQYPRYAAKQTQVACTAKAPKVTHMRTYHMVCTMQHKRAICACTPAASICKRANTCTQTFSNESCMHIKHTQLSKSVRQTIKCASLSAVGVSEVCRSAELAQFSRMCELRASSLVRQVDRGVCFNAVGEPPRGLASGTYLQAPARMLARAQDYPCTYIQPKSCCCSTRSAFAPVAHTARFVTRTSTHPLTLVRTHSRAYSLTHSTRSLADSLTHSLIHSLTHPLPRSLAHSLTRSLPH